MKTNALLILIALSALLWTQTCGKKGKKERKNKESEWDMLEAMVEETRKADRSNGDNNAEDADTEQTGGNEVNVNPCADHHCGWGKECQLNEKGKAHCTCATQCVTNPSSDISDKVCSNTNVTYDSICHLYRERCLCRREMADCKNPKNKHLHLQYLGQCKELEECTEEHLSQFSNRMADWLFQVMRDLKKRQELFGDKWIQLIEEAERDDHLRHVYPIIWKFCDLDRKPNDRHMTHQELIPLTAPVIPLESCIEPFLRQCDLDKDEKITLMEWGKCLGLQEDEIVEQC